MIRDVDVEAEIKDALGLVPSFFARIPDEAMAHEWDLFHHCELEETLIPSKYRNCSCWRCTLRRAATTALCSTPRFEFAPLIAAARWVAQGGEGELPADARQHLL